MTELKDLLEELKRERQDQGDLVAEVAALRSNQKTQKFLTAVLSILLVIVGYGVIVAREAATNAQDTADLVERLQVSREEDRLEQLAETCRTRNLAALQGRQEFLRAYDVLEEIIQDTGTVDRLRNSITPTDDTDIDCDGDGQLTEADYPTM